MDSLDKLRFSQSNEDSQKPRWDKIWKKIPKFYQDHYFSQKIIFFLEQCELSKNNEWQLRWQLEPSLEGEIDPILSLQVITSNGELRPISIHEQTYIQESFSKSEQLLLEIISEYIIRTEDKIEYCLPLSQAEDLLVYWTKAGLLYAQGKQVHWTQEHFFWQLELYQKNESFYFSTRETDYFTRDSIWVVSNHLVLIDQKIFKIFDPYHQKELGSFLHFFMDRSPLELSQKELAPCLMRVISDCYNDKWYFQLNLEIIKKEVKGLPCLYLKSEKNSFKYFSATVSFRYDKKEYPHPHHNGLDFISPPIVDIRVTQKTLELSYRCEHQIETTHNEFFKTFSKPLVKKTLLENEIFPVALPTLLENGWDVWVENLKLKLLNEFQMTAREKQMNWLEFDCQQNSHHKKKWSIWEIILLLKRMKFFIPLGDGEAGLLPTKWFELLEKMSHFYDPSQKAFGRSVSFLSSDNYDRENVRDEIYRNVPRVGFFHERLKSFKEKDVITLGSHFQGELRPYQKRGLNWLSFLHDVEMGGCLADDMGIGKSVQVIAWLDKLKSERRLNGPVLILCPKSLVHQWQDEIMRFSKKLRTTNMFAKEKLQEVFPSIDIFISSYGFAVSQNEEFCSISFFYKILDEAQLIKNSLTQRYQFIKNIKAKHRLALTGTPIENHEDDLKSIMQIINPGVFPEQGIVSLKKGNLKLKQNVRPFIMRRTKQEVLKDLPKKTIKKVALALEPSQQIIYDALFESFQKELKSKEKSLAIDDKPFFLELLLRLRMLCCHTELVDPAMKQEKLSSKTEYLLDKVAELDSSQSKILVFSQFSSYLKLIAKDLDVKNYSYAYVDGQTLNRESEILMFKKNPDCRVFLLSLRAAGFGLNLTEADQVFIMDPWWNVAVENQAIDRVYRMGQNKNILVHKLFIKNSIEETVLKLQDQKSTLGENLETLNDNELLSHNFRKVLDLICRD